MKERRLFAGVLCLKAGAVQQLWRSSLPNSAACGKLSALSHANDGCY